LAPQNSESILITCLQQNLFPHLPPLCQVPLPYAKARKEARSATQPTTNNQQSKWHHLDSGGQDQTAQAEKYAENQTSQKL
jgi:hypothetical protein